MTSGGSLCWGTGPGIWDQEDLEQGCPCCAAGFNAADSYSLRLSWQLTLYIEKLSFIFKRWGASQSFFSRPSNCWDSNWDVFPVNKDNLLSVVLWLKYSDTSNSEGWGFLISFFTAQSLLRKCIFMDLERTERHYYQWSYYYVKDPSLRFFPCFNWHWNTLNSLEVKCQGNKCYALLILNALAIWCLLY